MSSPPVPDREPDENGGSVTAWLNELKGGDPAAARHLWGRYVRNMLRFSRDRIRAAEVRAADEEDVALSAFDSFCRGAVAGDFPGLQGREEFWRLLAHIMSRKAADQVAHEKCWKRGGRATREPVEALDRVESQYPPPDLAAQMTEEVERLLGLLPDQTFRSVALMKLEGLTNEEIARTLDCAERTVNRKVLLIRRLWLEGPT